jgi:hypothetical protein
VVLDFRHLPKGAGVGVDHMKGKRQIPDRLRGMTGESTHWLLDKGVKMTGIEAVIYDPPFWAMFERWQF